MFKIFSKGRSKDYGSDEKSTKEFNEISDWVDLKSGS